MGLPTARSMQAYAQACIICFCRPFPGRSWAGPLTSSPGSPKMLLMELAHGDGHSGWFGGRSCGVNNCSVTEPWCLIKLHLCVEKESKSLALMEGWIVWDSSRHPGDNHIFLLELNWWVLFQTTRMGMLFIFISSSESLCPPFSHWEITLFSIPAYHKIRAWLHSIAFIPNCLWT